MKSILVSIGMVIGLCVNSAAAQATQTAAQIFEQYLKMTWPAEPAGDHPYDAKLDRTLSEARLARLAVLNQMKSVPQEEAVAAADPVIFKQATPSQRQELVGALGGNIQTRACADLLFRVLKDVRESTDKDIATYEWLARSEAVHGLRLMARRTDRSGSMRTVRGAEHDPIVPGLVPYLIVAAKDPQEEVRIGALYALADTREPEAVAAIRKCLTDKSDQVRFYAACFLTEFQDASGMEVLRAELKRLLDTAGNRDIKRWRNAAMLMSSFERITGKSFGAIPMDPLLASDSWRGANDERRYEELLADWQAWWNWQPSQGKDVQ